MSRMVVITGQVGTRYMRGNLPIKQRGLQEVDTSGPDELVTKVASWKEHRPSGGGDGAAFFLARSGRQGPVVVDLPMNIQRGAAAPPRRSKSAPRWCLSWPSTSIQPGTVGSPKLVGRGPAGGGVIVSRAGKSREPAEPLRTSRDHEHAGHGR